MKKLRKLTRKYNVIFAQEKRLVVVGRHKMRRANVCNTQNLQRLTKDKAKNMLKMLQGIT